MVNYFAFQKYLKHSHHLHIHNFYLALLSPRARLIFLILPSFSTYIRESLSFKTYFYNTFDDNGYLTAKLIWTAVKKHCLMWNLFLLTTQFVFSFLFKFTKIETMSLLLFFFSVYFLIQIDQSKSISSFNLINYHIINWHLLGYDHYFVLSLSLCLLSL